MRVRQLDLSNREIDAAQAAERPQPLLQRGQVRVRLHAWSLIFRDLLSINHPYLVATGAAKRIAPVIDKGFRFSDSIEAYRYVAGAQHLGKVVIRS